MNILNKMKILWLCPCLASLQVCYKENGRKINFIPKVIFKTGSSARYVVDVRFSLSILGQLYTEYSVKGEGSLLRQDM